MASWKLALTNVWLGPIQQQSNQTIHDTTLGDVYVHTFDVLVTFNALVAGASPDQPALTTTGSGTTTNTHSTNITTTNSGSTTETMLGATYHNSWSNHITTITSGTSTYDTTPRGVRGNFTPPPSGIGNTWATSDTIGG